MVRTRDPGLDNTVYILAGVGLLASAKAARCTRLNVPGIHLGNDTEHMHETPMISCLPSKS